MLVLEGRLRTRCHEGSNKCNGLWGEIHRAIHLRLWICESFSFVVSIIIDNICPYFICTPAREWLHRPIHLNFVHYSTNATRRRGPRKPRSRELNEHWNPMQGKSTGIQLFLCVGKSVYWFLPWSYLLNNALFTILQSSTPTTCIHFQEYSIAYLYRNIHTLTLSLDLAGNICSRSHKMPTFSIEAKHPCIIYKASWHPALPTNSSA